MPDYEYRYAAVRGLELRRLPKPINPGSQQGLNHIYGNEPKEPAWERASGDDFVKMTWQELEHVAHVIRDAIHSPP